MAPMNLKEIISRCYVLHVRSDAKVFKDERYYTFGEYTSKYSWRHHIETLMDCENYKYLSPYSNEDETNRCFEITYNTNHLLLEKLLHEIGAKLVTITKQYSQTLGGFRHRVAKMSMPRGILFDNMHHKMLFLLKHPNLYNEY